jgi:hypothetical protein
MKHNDVQICILLDMHRDMRKLINPLKDQIEDIINSVKKQYPMKTFEIAFIGYGGYHCIPSITFYGFTSNISQLQKNLRDLKNTRTLTCHCRDIQEAYGLASHDICWTANHRIIFHMGNAPAFGPKYHTPDVEDLFPLGHPYIVLEEQVERMAILNIDLVLLKLNKNMDKMKKVMEENYSKWRNTGFYDVDLVGKENNLYEVIFDEVKNHILRHFVNRVS